jgi:hypothetical protein
MTGRVPAREENGGWRVLTLDGEIKPLLHVLVK